MNPSKLSLFMIYWLLCFRHLEVILYCSMSHRQFEMNLEWIGWSGWKPRKWRGILLGYCESVMARPRWEQTKAKGLQCHLITYMKSTPSLPHSGNCSLFSPLLGEMWLAFDRKEKHLSFVSLSVLISWPWYSALPKQCLLHTFLEK